jgi:ribokinase
MADQTTEHKIRVRARTDTACNTSSSDGPVGMCTRSEKSPNGVRSATMWDDKAAGQVVVVGSVNSDVTARVGTLPRPGETVAGSDLRLLPGGKGANQAVAAARAGARVRLVGALGNDELARTPREFLAAEGLDLTGLVTVDGPAGTALILVDADGENVIVIIPGANATVDSQRVGALDLGPRDVVLLQNEIPEPANLAAARRARECGARSVLNLAPYRDTGAELLETVDVLVLNETEYAALSRRWGPGVSGPAVPVDTVGSSGADLNRPGNGDVVVTVGAAGVRARVNGNPIAVPAYNVPVLDTTGAGDCFCGAFGAALAAGHASDAALRFATAAAAVAVQRYGAAPAMPTRAEIEAVLER